MPRIAKKTAKKQARDKTKKPAKTKKSSAKIKATNNKKTTASRGAFSFNWGDKIDWFRASAKSLGMSGKSLIIAAVEEYVNKRLDTQE